jgi:exoribonuclease-2
VTAIFALGDDGLPSGAPRLVRSLVRVSRALSYAAADDPAALAPGHGGAELIALGERLAAARVARGAVVVELAQAKVTLCDGRPQVGVRHQGTPSDRLVSESMVLCNAAVAGALAAAGRAALFRVQDPPRHALPEGEDDVALRGLRTRRALSPGWLSPIARPHAGLALDAYAQATSPIRRYADLVNQRLLLDLLASRAPAYSAEELAELALFLEERRRVVRAATQAREAYWVARSLEPLLGGRIEGTLVRAPRRGLGAVWAPLVHRELPLRVPRGFVCPPVGTTGAGTLSVLRPWRGRIELSP